MNNVNITYFEAKNIPKEIKKILDSGNITANIYRIQAYNSITFGYVCIGFIDFILKDKSLLDYTNLFSLNEYEKNVKIILEYYQ